MFCHTLLCFYSFFVPAYFSCCLFFPHLFSPPFSCSPYCPIIPSPHYVRVCVCVIRVMHAEIISSIKNLPLDGEDPRKLLQSWGRLRFPRHILQWVCRQTWRQFFSGSVGSGRTRSYRSFVSRQQTILILYIHFSNESLMIWDLVQTSQTLLLHQETLHYQLVDAI